jgi:hypothetical protein
MKKLLAIIILSLCFITSSQADDISDFQIEGMSIGDSLLNYIDKNELINSMKYGFKSKEFAYIVTKKKSDTYDKILLLFNPDDKKFIIHSISARIFYPKDVNSCYVKKKEITKEFLELFKDVAKKDDQGTYSYSADKTGKSKVTTFNFQLDSGSVAHIGCYKFSKELRKERNFSSVGMLSISVSSKEYNEFQKYRAFK